jgi:hypothetical protein
MSAPTAEAITSTDLCDLLASSPSLRILDVRTPTEFETNVKINARKRVPKSFGFGTTCSELLLTGLGVVPLGGMRADNTVWSNAR